jgi:hypothetical protein
MTVVCSSCQRYLSTKPPYGDLGVTHGLCNACAIRQRRELKTLVVSRERADAWPVLESVLRIQSELHVVLDRRRADRRQLDLEVDACRRLGTGDRRQTQSLRLV